MDAELQALLDKAKARWDAMTPEERDRAVEAQRTSWVRAFTTPCEHGWLDFEDCPDCRAAASPKEGKDNG